MASVLNEHLPAIVDGRKKRKSWRMIQAELKKSGVKINLSALYLFFQRAKIRQIKINKEVRPFSTQREKSKIGVPESEDWDEDLNSFSLSKIKITNKKQIL